MHGQVNGRVDWWMGEWMDVRMDGGVCGWVDVLFVDEGSDSGWSWN